MHITFLNLNATISLFVGHIGALVINTLFNNLYFKELFCMVIEGNLPYTYDLTFVPYERDKIFHKVM